MIESHCHPYSYEKQLMEKNARFKIVMAPFSAPEPEVFPSPPIHYRMRAEFRIWHEGDALYHVMFDQKTRQPIRLDQFPAASQLINRLMTALINPIKTDPTLRDKLFQIDYLSTCSGKIIASLLYHRPLDEKWQKSAITLRESLRQQNFDLQLVGRAAKTKICLHQDHVDEILKVSGQNILYRQMENSFTQPNAAVNIQMLEWSLSVTKESQGDLLELYCGHGNFSLALSPNFRQILATEVSTSSVACAQFNIQANDIQNVKIARLSAKELVQAIQGVRSFYRLRQIELSQYEFKTILVDPPRSGLDHETLTLLKGFSRILYISCNPGTLCANLKFLQDSHQITRVALFDQFPYTDHIECGVFLEQRSPIKI